MKHGIPTKAETIDTLCASRDVLRAEAGMLSPAAGGYLWTAVDRISDEIDRLVANALADDEAYAPSTSAFKTETDQGRRFVGILTDIKILFARNEAVVRAVSPVVQLIPMAWLLAAIVAERTSL